MENTKKFATLVSLVGENPYPIYLGIRELASGGSTLVLVHSDHTEPIARRIKNIVSGEDWFKAKDNIILERINDEFDPVIVEKDLTFIRDKYPNSAINFTGGTKVMSAFGVIAWHHEKGWPATYLAEQRGAFLFADGQAQSLSDHDYTIKTLCQLHGAEEMKPGTPFGADRSELDHILSNRNALAVALGNAKDRSTKQWKINLKKSLPLWAEIVSTLPASLQNKCGMPEEQTTDKFEACCKFIDGGWLEEWLYDVVEALRSEFTWVKNQNFRINGQQFEVDLMTIHNHRLRYISVTTDSKENLCKGKTFEAIHRAHQVGGGMADIALVCLANDDVLKKISLSIGAGPGKKIRIFGESDAVEWQGGNLDTITEFLTA